LTYIHYPDLLIHLKKRIQSHIDFGETHEISYENLEDLYQAIGIILIHTPPTNVLQILSVFLLYQYKIKGIL